MFGSFIPFFLLGELVFLLCMDCSRANGIFYKEYLLQALSMFCFACWAAPKHVPVNQLFGVRSSMGMSILTFDWTQSHRLVGLGE